MSRIMLLLLVLAGLSLAANDQSKSVLTSLNANWNATSFLAEASEFIAAEDEKLFWKFVELINEESGKLGWNDLTDEKKYDYTIKTAAKILSTVDLLKFSLALRQYSPKVQSFQQIATEYGHTNCDVFIVSHGESSCDVSKLTSLLKNDKESEKLLENDHFIGEKDADNVIVLYGELGTSSLAEAFSTLKQQKNLKIVFRHYSRNLKESHVSLSGYGVELAIKNTEYKAVDESNNKKSEADEDETNLHGLNIKLLKQLHPDITEEIESLRAHLKDTDELAPLKKWQLQDLSYQAAQKVMNADQSNALNVLEDFSQNFPTHARNLAGTTVTENMKKEVEMNRKMLEKVGIDAGETKLFINGINQDINSLDLFKLSDLLKQEDRIANGFHDLGINREYLSILVGMDNSEEEKTYAIDYREAYPFYLNNLDTDKRYKQWGNSVKLMLQPYYPGMIRPIARNLFNLIFIIDPSTLEGRKLLRIGKVFHDNDIAIRIGYIFAVNESPEANGSNDLGHALVNLFNFVSTDADNLAAIQVLNTFLDNYKSNEPTLDDLKKWFKRKFSDTSFEDVFGPNSDYDKGIKAGINFMKQSGLNKAPQVLLNGFVLDEDGVRADNIEETIMMQVMKISPKIQKAVMEGALTDRMNVGNWALEQKDVMKRLNKRILTAPRNYVDLSGSEECGAFEKVEDIQSLSDSEKARCLSQNVNYLQKSAVDTIIPVTLWIVADADTADGREFIYNALQILKTSQKTRIGIIMNPTNLEKSTEASSVSSYIRAALEHLSPDFAKRLILKLTNEKIVNDFIAGKTSFEDISINGMDVDKFIKAKQSSNSADRIKLESYLSSKIFNFSPGQKAVIGNGLIVGPLDAEEKFAAADFSLFEHVLLSKGAEVVSSHLTKWGYEKKNGVGSNIALAISGLIGKLGTAQKRVWVSVLGDEHSVVTLPADDSDKPAIDVLAVIDPLTTEAQKLSSILKLIKKVTNSDVRIVMNPTDKHSELPLKRFYRYASSSELNFDQNGNLNGNIIKFDNLPSKQLLTLSLQAPDSWIVEAVYAEYDLDNIKMEQVTENVVAVFALQHLLLEGQCFDEVSSQPPRGLQFVLGTERNPKQFDTIVMANLGYFQLKANPGAWNLNLREGKSSEIYRVSSQKGAEIIGPDTLRVVIDSFSGRSIRVRVEKKEGMEDRNLLSDEEEGVWSSISSFVGSKDNHEVINVFSLASGHLYERFMRIMIVSVMKHAKQPVKFWLLKNYLSPQFKKTLPLMADYYGFEYQLVEYKWPRWLHQQKEKQRIMWGYKILFLDVLFPLDVQKIIFVDADQVVRADLMELMKFDLGNAPYGYVPFCESRKEMDGFRFWKQGYWANHLAGRKYHISALYVIDLQKFRQIAAGDRLRGQYQGLSSDPNSLANLDQDLPNNMIHQVKIKSLPQEWLWCETWCDDGSKKNAKTIDLCNNPLTKEPKLDSAHRIIGEWKEYDDEIRQVISGDLEKSNTDEHSEL